MLLTRPIRLLGDGSGQSPSLLKSLHRAWRHNSEFSAFIVDRRPSTSTPPRTQAGTRSSSTVQAIRLYIQLFSEYHTEATSLRFLLLTLSSFVVLFTAKLALPRRSSDTQRCHSPIPTGGESISSVPTRSSVQLLPVGVWLAWNGFAPFSPSSSPQSPLVDAASALVLLLRSCHRAARHTFSCSPPTAPPSSSSSPLPPFVQYFSFPLVHVLPRILVLTPQRIRRTPSGPAVHFARYPPQGKAYPDPEWSSRSSSLAIRCQEGVSGPRVVQAFIFTRYPPPGGRIRIPSGPGVRPHSLSASRKAYRDPEWSRRSSSLAIRRQEGVSGPPVVQAFVRTRYPPPERRIGTPSGPAVHIHSLSATGEALPDRDRSYRSSSLAIRRQEGAPRPREVQPFIFTRYPLPGRRIRTATGPGDYLHPLSAARKPHPDPSGPTVHLHSLSATRKAYPDPEWSRRSSALAIRLQKGVSGPRVVQSFIFTRCPLPGRRIRTLDGPAVHLHSLSASRKAYPDREWSSRSSSLAIRCQEGVSGPRVVQPFIFTHYPPPGRRIRTPSGPGVHLHSLSAARKAYPDPEWSRRSSSLAIRRQEGVSGPRVVQAFIRTRYPPPERRIGTPSGPAVHLHSLSAARKAYRDPGWSSRSSSVTVRHREGVSRPRLVLPFIFTRYPPPGRRILTPSGPGVHLHSLSATRKAYPDPEWSRRSSALAIRLQKGVSGPRVVQSFIFTRSPLPGRRIRTLDGPAVHLHSLYASRKAYPDREWSSRSSSLATRRQEGVSGPRVVQPFIFTRYPPPGRRIRTPSGPGVHLHPLSAARKAYPDHERSRRLSSLAIRCQEGVSGPREVQPFIFTRYPPPGRRTGTPSGPSVHLQSLSAARKAYRDPECPAVHFLLAIRRQEGVSGPPVVPPFIFSRYPPPRGRFRTATGQAFIFARLSASRKAYTVPRGQPFFLTRLSAVRRTHADRGWSSRSRQLAYLPPGSRFRFAHAFSRSS